MTERSEIKGLIEKAYAARVKGDLDALMTYFHPDCRFQLMGAAEREAICRPQQGCVAVRGQMAELIGAFRFTNFETLDVVVEGDRAAYHWQADVTFVPTGRTETFQTLDLLSFEDGKVRSVAQFTDTAGVARITAAAVS